MCITVYPGTPIPTRLSFWRRRAEQLSELGRAWQRAALERRRLRALRGLSDATLRDIGMLERMPPERYSLAEVDFRRGL
jgi:uncharacterized protein YjiS (DUF1127 family)